jgi:hypothetical protein
MNFEGSVAEEIIGCERRLRLAQLASDVGQLDALIADELLFVDVRGRLVTKMMDLESHRSGTLKLMSCELRDQQILPLSGDGAVAIVQISLVGNYGGEEFAGDGVSSPGI